MPVMGDSSEDRSEAARPCDVDVSDDVRLVPPTVVAPAIVNGKDVFGFVEINAACWGNAVY